MGVELCRAVELPVAEDAFGDLAFAEAGVHVPFPIRRVFFVYGVPDEAVRGGHAHRRLEQAVFCLNGRLEILLRDGQRQRRVRLTEPHTGIYLPPMVWHDLGGFAAGTVYLVLGSEPFDEADYIRDYDEYTAALAARGEADGSP